ncbi:caspase family protein [Desulfomarina sp.]
MWFPSNGIATSRSIKRVRIHDASGKQVALYEKSYALLIGASGYTNGWPSLPGVKKDMKAIKKSLVRQGFVVQVVNNPTGKTLRNTLKQFARKYGRSPENRLLIYFAGHGHTLTLPYGGEMGYIVPVDSPNPEKNLDGFLDTALDMQEMSVLARRILANHVLFLFDSCFSGSIFALTRATPKSISYKTSRPVRQFITSGSAEEEVPDNSIFRRQLVAALNGEADGNQDGYVTGNELGIFLQDKVINYSNEAQHPQYGKLRDPKLDKGDFVFVVNVESSSQPAEAVVLPPEAVDIGDYTPRIAKRAAARKKWQNWQKKMEQNYNRLKGYDHNVDLSPLEKQAAWKEFTLSYQANNPDTIQDEQYREYAERRIAHWKKQENKKKNLTDPTTGMEFVYVPGGCFQMGQTAEDKRQIITEKGKKSIKIFTEMNFHVMKYVWMVSG